MTLRFATYNTSLYSEADRGLIDRLERGDEAARRIAAVIQTVRPDVVLLNEFDYDPAGEAATLFLREYLGRGQHGQRPIEYAHHFSAPVNTGLPSGLDIDRDGKTDGPADAWGFGHHPGQYGMLVLSRLPLDTRHARTFQHFLWRDMPGALFPTGPDGRPWYDDATWNRLRLSSKSHWDVPIDTGRGVLHLLASHPTPPVFDGPEGRNRRRNHDEIRLWADYVSGDTTRAGYLQDDRGQRGGLRAGALFVIAGDLNADPVDGATLDHTIAQLLEHPRVNSSPVPSSPGGVEHDREQTQKPETPHRGNPAHDTCVVSPEVGNLRLDYVLPSRGLTVRNAGVFWPVRSDPAAAWVTATDHRMVYVDLELPP